MEKEKHVVAPSRPNELCRRRKLFAGSLPDVWTSFAEDEKIWAWASFVDFEKSIDLRLGRSRSFQFRC